jgi:transposase
MESNAAVIENAILKARLADVEAVLAEMQEAYRRLEDILRTVQREQFGKRSEKLSPDQFNWVGRACFHLIPVIDHMRAHLRKADRIFVDETRAPVLDPGRKTTKSGYFWAVVSDDRGHGGVGPPIVLFHYAPGRGQGHPLKFLAGYRGRFLQCDAYQAYNAMPEIPRDSGPWQLVYCWTHVRRRFVKRFENDRSPIAQEMLRQIALLYQVEKMVRGKEPALRLTARREHATPIIAALKPWLEAKLSHIPQKSQLAEDIRYTLAHWSGLIRFLDDGTLEMDTNPVENQIRPIALTRKNALFAGNEIGAENWAMLASLIATCKMSGPNPVDYIADTLRSILDGHPKSRSEDLMPWRFNQPSSLAA